VQLPPVGRDLQPEKHDELHRYGMPGAWHRRGGRHSYNDRWQDAYGGPGRLPTRVDFRGRGPRGYQRSDERVREDACELLTADEQIDASNVEVIVQDAAVTLSGGVSSRAEKRRAEDIVAEVSGVKDVHNRLRVVNEGGLIEGSNGW
jgi:osmotically-inducible protein OsmY